MHCTKLLCLNSTTLYHLEISVDVGLGISVNEPQGFQEKPVLLVCQNKTTEIAKFTVFILYIFMTRTLIGQFRLQVVEFILSFFSSLLFQMKLIYDLITLHLQLSHRRIQRIHLQVI